MNYNQQQLPHRSPKGNPTLFSFRVLHIWQNKQEGITKHRGGFFEIYAVLLPVGTGL